jgi:small subunit ribosomal protein S2
VFTLFGGIVLDKVFVRDLIDAGIHFGHRVSRWNPKMKPYIFCSRNSIHIINIKETIKGLLRSKKLLENVVSSGLDVLFVGTKRQARQPIVEQADRCGMHYVSERWLGGILTNFRTIRSRLGRLVELEEMEESGEMASHSKKRQSTLRREKRRIDRNLGGVRKMDKLPGLLVIVDSKREYIAVNEARKLGIPTVCLIDTDSDPDVVDIPIPGNDDAMKGIEMILTQLTDSAIAAKEGRVEAQVKASEQGGDAPRKSRRVSTARAAEELASATTEEPQAPTESQPVSSGQATPDDTK